MFLGWVIPARLEGVSLDNINLRDAANLLKFKANDVPIESTIPMTKMNLHDQDLIDSYVEPENEFIQVNPAIQPIPLASGDSEPAPIVSNCRCTRRKKSCLRQ